MRVVALEEHFSVPAAVKRIDPAAIKARGFQPRRAPSDRPSPMELLPELGERRMKSMDDNGITVQVLSHNGPGPDLVAGAEGVAMAREINDYLAETVARRPDRFAGFATLPMLSPDACAEELARCVKELRFPGAMVHGTTQGRFLDHPSYDGLLAAAVGLDVPIYIHPHLAPAPVREAEALFKRKLAGIVNGVADGIDRHSRTQRRIEPQGVDRSVRSKHRLQS